MVGRVVGLEAALEAIARSGVVPLLFLRAAHPQIPVEFFTS